MIKINIKKKPILIIISVTLFSLILLTSSTYSQNELKELDLNKVETPTEVSDFIELFSSFEFRIVEKEEGELIRENYIEITHEGQEKIQGVQTNKVTLTGKGTDQIPFMEFWFKKNNDKLVKIIIDEQEIPPKTAENMIDNMLQAVFYPFHFYKQYNLNEYEEFNSAEISKSTKIYNEKEYEVTTIKMNKLEMYELASGVMSIADFNDFLLVVSYDLVTLEEQNLIYTVESLELK